MPNPDQTVPLDVMIKRLEEANARAHERAARAVERVSGSEQDASPHASDQRKPPAAPGGLISRGRLALGLIGLLLAATLGVVALVSRSSNFDAAKMIVARWALPLAQNTPPVVAPTAAPLPAELAQHLQAMALDLANMAQGIEQLKTDQEQMVRDNAAIGGQLKVVLSQMNRDGAAVAELLKAVLSQITRDNAAIVEQLKASQEQTVRPTDTRARRKPTQTLPQDGEAVILGR